MKRVVLAAMLGFLTGCSNAPIAGFLDVCFPSKPAGPVCQPSPPAGQLPPPELGVPVGPPRQ